MKLRKDEPLAHCVKKGPYDDVKTEPEDVGKESFTCKPKA
jgi:hypothetical protein